MQQARVYRPRNGGNGGFVIIGGKLERPKVRIFHVDISFLEKRV